MSIKPMLISPGSVFDLFSSTVPWNFRLKVIAWPYSRYIVITIYQADAIIEKLWQRKT